MHGSKAITLSSGDWQRAARAASRGRVNCARHELKGGGEAPSHCQGVPGPRERVIGSQAGWAQSWRVDPRWAVTSSPSLGRWQSQNKIILVPTFSVERRGEGRGALAVALGRSPAGGRRGRVASFRDERQLWGCGGPAWGRTQELPTDRPQCGRDAEKASGGLKGRRLAFSRASRTRGLWGRLPGAA